MFRKAIISAALVLGMSSFAMAQTATTTPGAAAGQLTEAQIKQKLQQEGYSNVELNAASASRGLAGSSGGSTTGTAAGTSAAGNDLWTGTAEKAGKKVNIQVDSTGKVTER
jgi:hypothetical protein